MSDGPLGRAAFSFSTSLLIFLIKEDILSKPQAIKFVDGLISAANKQSPPDSDLIQIATNVRKGLETVVEPGSLSS